MALELVHDPTKRFKCYQKRNMVILKDGGELQSLVCIYKPDHITSMISLSGAFNPSEYSPMACNVLHLIELMGQASPMFISHQLQQPEPGSISCSDSVISSFRSFHKQFFEYISLDIFTSVSMSKHMHEDICWLALSRSLYLILLPFHRTWSVDRSTVISSDDKLRMININVLRRAPCSVGIFIYRKPIVEHHMAEYHSKICLIFNDGKDDREALAVTNRMRLTEKRISLTIIRFIPKISEIENQYLGENFQMVSLKETVTNIIGFDVKENDDYVTYIDTTVSDGSETSKILRSMANDYDLFVVGRSSGVGTEVTNGISEWAEFDELGPIGDLLASHEFPSRASVLVVQKQEYFHSAKSKRGLSKIFIDKNLFQMDAQEETWHKGMLEDHMKREEMGKNMICDVSPHIMLNSRGAWEKLASGSEGLPFWEYPLPKLEIIILSTFISWRFFDILFKKLGVPIPRFTSMMLVGAVLSESFQPMQMSWFRHIFIPDDYMPNVAETIGTFAFTLNWFLRGVTTNVGMLKKSKTKSTAIGVTSMIIPWYIGKIVYSSREKSSILTMTRMEYSISIFTMSMAPFTCINMLLTDLKVVHTEFGQIAQSSAMVIDVLAFCMSVWANVSYSYRIGMRMGVALMIFFVFLYLVRQAMLWVVRHTPEGTPVKSIYPYIGLLLAYLSHIYWTRFLFFGPLGAFVLGLAIPDGPPLGSVFIKKFDSFNEGIFLPLFGSFTMMKLDWSFLIKEIGSGKFLHGHTYECFSFLLVLYVAKFVTSFLSAIAARMPLRDSVILGIIMGTKSSFELAYVLQAFEKEIISLEIFSLLGIYILANSLLTPMGIHFLYDRAKRFACYGRRSLKHKSELQLLVCINKPDNITSMINLLRATAPSKDSPVSCCVLHLLELVGKATPTFISHQLQKPKPGSRSYSENVISSFQLFQEINQDYTSIHIFTSLTSVKEMHEHICWFALDKSSYLILLSFHRTWGANGYGVTSDDQTLRHLNRNVLKRAPCSVGILVYRKPLWQPKSIESPCRVCLVYVGGNDDKEALALADHMRGNQNVSITVLTLIPISKTEEGSESSQSQMVDTCQVEEKPGDNSITYIVRMVEDGNKTSEILHSVAYDYDMFLVGRSSGMGTAVTKGLGDWMEFDELGVIGDLIASEDFPSRASVLVIQQQE
ncbi:hypothetical protein DY000_02058056 [Brassica cretica]|uniref:Cation/H+ exchanger domain-containing protein n=1 Tax=Brassica cretica TaxID=69181 RepID=A0ABQ7AA11_BRACR|nr:hypothetical protein DY000_02058056 [Brassica cretica]